MFNNAFWFAVSAAVSFPVALIWVIVCTGKGGRIDWRTVMVFWIIGFVLAALILSEKFETVVQWLDQTP